MHSHSKCSLKTVSKSTVDSDVGMRALRNIHSIQKVKNMIFHTAQYHHPMSPRLVDPMRFEVMWHYQQTLKHSVVDLYVKVTYQNHVRF